MRHSATARIGMIGEEEPLAAEVADPPGGGAAFVVVVSLLPAVGGAGVGVAVGATGGTGVGAGVGVGVGAGTATVVKESAATPSVSPAATIESIPGTAARLVAMEDWNEVEPEVMAELTAFTSVVVSTAATTTEPLDRVIEMLVFATPEVDARVFLHVLMKLAFIVALASSAVKST